MVREKTIGRKRARSAAFDVVPDGKRLRGIGDDGGSDGEIPEALEEEGATQDTNANSNSNSNNNAHNTRAANHRTSNGSNSDNNNNSTAEATVCKHWLRGNCWNGKACDFRHQYDYDHLPQCHFDRHFGECNNPGCVFGHKNDIRKRTAVTPTHSHTTGGSSHAVRAKHKRRSEANSRQSSSSPNNNNSNRRQSPQASNSNSNKSESPTHAYNTRLHDRLSAATPIRASNAGDVEPLPPDLRHLEELQRTEGYFDLDEALASALGFSIFPWKPPVLRPPLPPPSPPVRNTRAHAGSSSAQQQATTPLPSGRSPITRSMSRSSHVSSSSSSTPLHTPTRPVLMPMSCISFDDEEVLETDPRFHFKRLTDRLWATALVVTLLKSRGGGQSAACTNAAAWVASSSRDACVTMPGADPGRVLSELMEMAVVIVSKHLK